MTPLFPSAWARSWHRSDIDLDALGEQLAARKKELTAKYKKKLAKPSTTTFGTVKV